MSTPQPSTVIDGVNRLPVNGIKIVIIGAGNGGMGTALECWRKGCEVVVLERAPALSPLGDYITITPSALTTLNEFPSMHADYHRKIYDCSIHVYTPSGTSIKSTVPEWKLPGVVHSAPDVDISFLKRRSVIAQMQLDQLKRLGVPVHFGQKVANVQETQDEVIVITAEGQEFRGDVCIGAMGTGHRVPGFDAGPEVAVQDSGYAVARVCFNRDVIKEGSLAARLLQQVTRPEFRTYVADDLHLILYLTDDWIGWVFTHQNDGMSAESWGNTRSVEEIIPYLEKASNDWDPAVLDFIRQTPGEVVDWNLRWRDYAEQWTSEGGRLLRLGDAAHAFFPTAGNGAVQALEDSVSIGECIRIAGKENVRWATKVHNKLRFQRVAILQRTGFINREELHHADIAAIEAHPEDAEIGFFKIGRWVWDHNPEHYARENYDACLESIQTAAAGDDDDDGVMFKNTNIPPGHVFEPWSLASEKERMEKGIPSGLKQNGDWSF